MDRIATQATYIPYRETGAFSKIVEDYLAQEPVLKEFYAYQPDIAGIEKAISERKNFPYNRSLLVNELTSQYARIQINEKLGSNLEALSAENCFTVCTAHQPNIFTGHLYFIYKILHTIKLADELNEKIAGYNFVPVYYMGSEDADLEELGEITIAGKKYEWKTDQKGAVGRMKVDKSFIDLMNEMEAQLSVENFGKEIIEIVRRSYKIGKTIEQGTFTLVHHLFGEKGLVILLPDNPAFKKEFSSVTERELFEQFSQPLVAETIAIFPQKYKVQAVGRELNLFYLKDDLRERLEFSKDRFNVTNSLVSFSVEEMRNELHQHPEHFSPNVILRPLFQELILPNIAFIGGGGELAYWLELKKIFQAASVPYPVLILRNSFMFVNKKTGNNIARLGFSPVDFFKNEKELIEDFVKGESNLVLDLVKEKQVLLSIYEKIRGIAFIIDPTLKKHVESLSVQALKRIESLEKKMLRAEKKKFDAAQRQISKIKSSLFPTGILQERVENLMAFYSLFGKKFIEGIFENSKTFEQRFCILSEQ